MPRHLSKELTVDWGQKIGLKPDELNGQPSDSRNTVTVFLNLILRVNATYALGCWHQNWIKGGCTYALFLAPLPIPAATVFFSPKLSTISSKSRYVCGSPSPQDQSPFKR